ncbi:TetR/AcrR family transcriptional regulator [Nonomuraea rhodomycinica]|uniref:TetR/AcrR family transcriptional regulator n=1 Tax=Nonomuraea rhodomycinica TaxID=1712872 RepID=A0A7Y6MBM2_9ACTN|nr:TetR/AcrR family transcriptional regulator [Nonomuraea rhodomycinica]NUW40639.1 TetR/AcrR family transcriptional regulator [Nonomuraea rhodomycinica]
MTRLTADDWAAAALAALAEGGLSAVAVEPVAQRLGVSKGSFYWHFANRRALVEAALRRWEADTERVISGLERIPEPAERMRALLERAFGDPRDAAVSFRLISEADDPLVGEVARRVSSRRLAYMEEILRQAGRPAEEARGLAVSAYGKYLGLAALVRVGALDEPPASVDSATAELGL